MGAEGAGGFVSTDRAGRIEMMVLRAVWSRAKMNAKQRKKAILSTLQEAMPPEEYARALVKLTNSPDARVQARGLELIGKLQGTLEEEESSTRVVVAFGSVLTGQQVGAQQGGTGHALESGDDESPEDGD